MTGDVTHGAGSAESPDFHHVPVLLDRVVELFADLPAGLYVDATLGGAGHAKAVLEANPRLRLLGLDRDETALNASSRRLAGMSDRTELVHTGFDRIEELVSERTTEGAIAVLMDLGVSSPQLDEMERGFSYRGAAQLDMRMDRRQTRSAMDVVNDYSFPELARVLREFGEERFASKIARAIIDARPVVDTEELADIIRTAIPAAARRTGGHPAKKSFQAIRIEVNRELEQLTTALDGALASLAPGGRLAVMSYHSLEDRIVKSTLREAETGGCVCPPGLPCACGAVPTVRLLKRGAWKASAEEIAVNRRAESVRLRAAERLAEQAS
ncbi:MAG: 16S rRNA (cytosine(1402)-N(4))-methyltransferase RsmH [Microthrixaceae bacterium]